jgi:hypothetical protein
VTKQEWKKRCEERIRRAVNKAGRIRIRDLKRATHYNRGPRDDDGIGLSIECWYGALEYLEKIKAIECERDEYDSPVWAMTPVMAMALRVGGVSPAKRVSPVAELD